VLRAAASGAAELN